MEYNVNCKKSKERQKWNNQWWRTSERRGQKEGGKKSKRVKIESGKEEIRDERDAAKNIKMKRSRQEWREDK